MKYKKRSREFIGDKEVSQAMVRHFYNKGFSYNLRDYSRPRKHFQNYCWKVLNIKRN